VHQQSSAFVTHTRDGLVDLGFEGFEDLVEVVLVFSSLLLKVVCSLLQLLQLLGILRFQVLQLLLVVSARNSVPLNFLASLLELLLELQVLLGSFTLDT